MDGVDRSGVVGTFNWADVVSSMINSTFIKLDYVALSCLVAFH